MNTINIIGRWRPNGRVEASGGGGLDTLSAGGRGGAAAGSRWLPRHGHTPPTPQATSARFSHAAPRPRTRAAHKRGLARLWRSTGREGMTLVPLKLYFNDKGIAKLELGIAKGKKLGDKRETEKRRDWAREKGRLLREKG